MRVVSVWPYRMAVSAAVSPCYRPDHIQLADAEAAQQRPHTGAQHAEQVPHIANRVRPDCRFDAVHKAGIFFRLWFRGRCFRCRGMGSNGSRLAGRGRFGFWFCTACSGCGDVSGAFGFPCSFSAGGAGSAFWGFFRRFCGLCFRGFRLLFHCRLCGQFRLLQAAGLAWAVRRKSARFWACSPALFLPSVLPFFPLHPLCAGTG